MTRVSLSWAASLVFIALISTSSLIRASEPPDSCEAFDNAIENALKLVASENARGIGDSSAPRATLQEIKINNQLQLVSVNLQLRRDYGCPTFKGPILEGRYLQPALECQNDLLSMRLGREVPKAAGSALPLTCDMATWKPTGSDDDAAEKSDAEQPAGAAQPHAGADG